jgi:hypothetical protein
MTFFNRHNILIMSSFMRFIKHCLRIEFMSHLVVTLGILHKTVCEEICIFKTINPFTILLDPGQLSEEDLGMRFSFRQKHPFCFSPPHEDRSWGPILPCTELFQSLSAIPKEEISRPKNLEDHPDHLKEIQIRHIRKVFIPLNVLIFSV